MDAKLAPHEALEIREFISQEMLGVKKINASMNMVKDDELRSFMQDSMNAKKYAIKEIQSTLSPQSQNQ